MVYPMEDVPKKKGVCSLHSLSAVLQKGSLQFKFISHKKSELSTLWIGVGHVEPLEVGLTQKGTDLLAYWCMNLLGTLIPDSSECHKTMICQGVALQAKIMTLDIGF